MDPFLILVPLGQRRELSPGEWCSASWSKTGGPPAVTAPTPSSGSPGEADLAGDQHVEVAVERVRGRRRIVLETGGRQPEAIQLYLTAGYARIPDFGFYKDEPDVHSLGKDLDVSR